MNMDIWIGLILLTSIISLTVYFTAPRFRETFLLRAWDEKGKEILRKKVTCFQVTNEGGVEYQEAAWGLADGLELKLPEDDSGENRVQCERYEIDTMI